MRGERERGRQGVSKGHIHFKFCLRANNGLVCCGIPVVVFSVVASPRVVYAASNE